MMLRYENKGNDLITVDLKNGYTAIGIAKRNNEINNYTVTLMIKENTVDLWNLCENAQDIIFNSDRKNIRKDMAVCITEKLNEGFFKYYIDRYEYEQKCFECGHEMLEKINKK